MPFIKKTKSRILFEIFNYIILTFGGIIFLAPFWHVLMASISDPTTLNGHAGIVLWPLGKMTLEGYTIVLNNAGIWKGYLNTLWYVSVGTGVSMLLTIIGGYCLSRKQFRARDFLMMFISFTMLFNGGLIPTYMVVKNLGLLGTRWGVIAPSAISVFNLIIMRTSFQEVPETLEEAARIDGANDWTIMVKIIIPLAKATIAVIALFYAVSLWNSWFNANIYLNGKRALYPLQLILKEILINNDTNSVYQSAEDVAMDLTQAKVLVQYCVILVATVPILCVYPFIQKYFTKGVMIGAVKG